MFEFDRIKSDYFSPEFSEILEAFLGCYKNERTQVEVGRAVKNLCNFCKKDFLSLEGEDVQTYFDDMARNVTSGTFYSRKSWFHQLGVYIEKNYPNVGYEDSFHLVKCGEVSQKIKSERIPSLKDIDNILEASKENPMFYLIFLFAFRCALTSTQIVSMRRDNIIFKDERAYFHFPKTMYDKEKLLVIPKDIYQPLVAYYTEVLPKYSDEYLFHNQFQNQLTLRNLDSAVTKYRNKANVEGYFTMSDLRSRSILEMVNASDKSPESLEKIAVFSGLHSLRLSSYVHSASLVEECPADLVNFELKKK